MHCRSPGPHPGGSWGVRPEWGLQAHTQGEVEGSGMGVSRPTPGGLQAHTWGSPGPHPVGKLRVLAWGGLQAHTRGVSRPTPRGVSRPTPRVGLQAHTRGGGGEYPSMHWGKPTGMHSFSENSFRFSLVMRRVFPAGMSLHLYLFFPLPTFASMYWSAHTNRLWISLKRLLRLHVIIFEKKKNESYFIEQVTINFDIALRSFPIPLLKNLAWYIQFSEKIFTLYFSWS